MHAPRFTTGRPVGTTLYLSGATLALLAVAGRINPPSHAVPTLRIVAHDYRYDLPTRIAAGVVRVELVNEGSELHHAQILRLEQGKTVRDLAALPAEAPPPSWAVPVGGPNAVMPGDSGRALEALTSGNYAVVCFIPSVTDGVPHMMKGMVAAFTVGQPASPAVRMPKADLTIRLADYNFARSAPIHAGARTIRVVNDAPQPHELVLVRLDDGKTVGDLMTWSAAHMQGPPPGRFVGGVVGLAPGASNLLELTLDAGNYALICYLPDAKDGKPHFVHGMIAPLTVAPSR